MKLAMAQMQIGSSIEENLHKSLRCIELAGKAGAELLFSRSFSYRHSSLNTKNSLRNVGS